MYNILIVDDEKIERNGIKFLIKKLGMHFNISEAENGQVALDYLLRQKEEGGHTDILLTDVKMPFIDGIELIRKIKENNLLMKNIIFSGYNEFEYAKLAVKLGVSDYILKPVDPKEFKSTIEKVIQELNDEKSVKLDKDKTNGYMKEYLLYSLINGTDLNTIHEKKKQLEDSSFWNEYNRMLLLEFENDFFGKEVNDFYLDFLKDFMNEKNDPRDYLYLNLNQQQGIIFINSKESNSEYYFAEAEKLHNLIKEKYNVNCYVSVSDIFNDYTEIENVMNNLESLMENRFYQNNTYVFSNNVKKENPILVQIDDDTLMKQMKQDIKMKDVDGLRNHFDKLCKKYRCATYFSHIYIKFIFSNLLKDFYDNIPDMKEEQFNLEIDTLYKSEDFGCIMNIVNKHIDMLEKAFENNPQMQHREIETVKKYIYEHYSEEIGVEQLANLVYLAPSYLSSLFKKETGQNLSKFIKQYRMEKAKDMLENSNKKIVQISSETGYPNVSYFCQSFREYFGISPQKFRDEG